MEKDTVDSIPAIVAIDLDNADFVTPIKSHSILDSSNVSTNPSFPDFLGQHNQTDFLLQGINEREMLRLQHFYNNFTTNHRWLVVIGSNLKLTLRLLFCPNNNNQ